MAGDARVASPEKGEALLSGCAAALADIVVRDPWAKEDGEAPRMR
ncbi:hypothetical protein ACU639_01825 [Streptomyces cynarae]